MGKGYRGFWVDGAVDDKTFIQAIKYWITEGIMQIPDT